MITVIGGGPAGMSAALAASESGAKVLLIESGPRLGGQYWRHLPESGPQAWSGQEELHGDYSRGARLRAQVLASPHIEVLFNTYIWQTSHRDGRNILQLQHGDRRREIVAETLILASGAFDRVLPFPGWEIPGVMTPGAAQSLLKGSSVKAGRRVVVAGTGPFLLPVAAGLLEAGVEIAGLYEANTKYRWARYFHLGIRNIGKLKQAREYLGTFKMHQVKMRRGFAVIAAHAGENGELKSVTVARIGRDFARRGSDQITVECDALAIGWGFTPDLSIANSLGLRQVLCAEDGNVVVDVDQVQCTSRAGVFAAGEVTGIGGSELALTEGRIAGLAAAVREGALAHSDFQELLTELAGVRTAQQKFATALLRMHCVGARWSEWLNDETLICRCEEVTQKEIKSVIHELDATDVRTVKLLTRCGMGMCQGRICARSVADLVARETGSAPSLLDRINAGRRPIIAPITLGLLAREESVEESG